MREIIQELECNQRKLSLDHDKAAPLQGTDEFSDHSGLNDESGTAEFAEHPPKDDNGKNPYSCDTVKSIQDVDDVLISQEHATTCTANMEKVHPFLFHTLKFTSSHQFIWHVLNIYRQLRAGFNRLYEYMCSPVTEPYI